MNFLKKTWWQFRRHSSGVGTLIGLVSLLFSILLSLWPSIFNVNQAIIDSGTYHLYKDQLSNQGITFIEKVQNENKSKYVEIVKSIPETLPANEKNKILDIIKFNPISSDVNKLFYLLIISLLLLLFFYRELSGGRKYRIAHSVKHLHLSIHIIRDNWKLIFQKNGKDHIVDKGCAKKFIKESLDEVAHFFSIVTGTPCRACIKVIVDNETLQVKTFARSTYCDLDNLDKDTSRDKKQDFVYNNSDYKALIGSNNRYWCVGDVDNEPNYENSHVDNTSKVKKSKQLGYKSSFTWPIRKVQENGNPKLYGFLCIDSNVTKAFHERYDFDCGALVADFYYFLLRAYFKISELMSREI